jgi:hypothetical protein
VNLKNDRAEMTWAPRVKLQLIRELYLNDAGGIRDEELTDEVGFGLFSRCMDIMEFTHATEGQVACKRCSRMGITTILARQTLKPNEVLKCPQCSWQIRWKVYLAETNRIKGQLIAGHARAAFEEYLRVFPKCHTYQEKMLAIDRLIHEFHRELGRDGMTLRAIRTASANLLEGTTTEVLSLLDSLAYSTESSPELEGGKRQRIQNGS